MASNSLVQEPSGEPYTEVQWLSPSPNVAAEVNAALHTLQIALSSGASWALVAELDAALCIQQISLFCGISVALASAAHTR